MRHLRFLFTTPAYKPAFRMGGPIHSVAALAEGIVKRGHQVLVGASNHDMGVRLDVPLNQDYMLNGVTVQYFDAKKTLLQYSRIPYFSKAGVFRFGRDFSRWLARVGGEVDVFNSQISFQTANVVLSNYAVAKGKVFLYHQRGNLDPVRLKTGRWKKAVYIYLRERRVLERADALIALTKYEADAYRRLVNNARVEIIPNGIDPGFSDKHLGEASCGVSSLLRDCGNDPLFLFLGRLHPLKGPQIFVEACLRALESGSRFRAIVAGPDELGMRRRLEGLVLAAGMGRRIKFLGSVAGADRLELYKRSDCFVLPSESEGLSMAMLEALACGCAVIATPGAHFDEIQAIGAGVIVERSVEGLSAAVRVYAGSGRANLGDRGRAGKAFVEKKYSWDTIVDRYLDCVSSLMASKARGSGSRV